MRGLLFILAVLGLLWASHACIMAAPTISSVSGTLEQESAVVIYGSDFGVKDSGVVIYDRLTNVVAYEEHNLSHGDTIPVYYDGDCAACPWDKWHNLTWNYYHKPTYYDSTHSRTPNRPACRVNRAGYFRGFDPFVSGLSESSEIYMSWWVRANHNLYDMRPEGGTVWNKFLRHTTEPGDPGFYDGHFEIESHIIAAHADTCGKGTISQVQNTYPSYLPELLPHGWHHIELRYTGGGDLADSSGSLFVTFDGKTVVDTNGIWSCTGFPDMSYVWGSDPNVPADYPANSEVLFGEYYIDTTRARVVLSSISNYTWPKAESTHCEVQEMTYWSADSIGVTFDLGEYIAADTIWAYVFDAAGSMSSGFAVPLSGEAPWSPSPDLITVPAGVFTMGDGFKSPDSLYHGCARDEHVVTLQRSFYLGKYEVSNQEYVDAAQWAYDNNYCYADADSVWDNLDGSSVKLMDLAAGECEVAFADGSFSVAESESAATAYPEGYDEANHPVKEVTWYGAARYCDWLSLKLGLERAYDQALGWDPDDAKWLCNDGDPYNAEGYRLPTDAEREYAAQYDDEGFYPWDDGDPWGVDSASCNRANYATPSYCVGWTVAVGTDPAAPSALGLYELSGNVWEWCNDWFACNLGEVAVTDPVGPDTSWARVAKGGAWSYNWETLRSAYREGYELAPGDADREYGLRIAKTAPSTMWQGGIAE